MSKAGEHDFEGAVSQLEEAADAKKCWPCGCLHGSLDSNEQSFPDGTKPKELAAVIRSARSQLRDIKYDCLGCEVCYPAIAMNALNVDVDACPTDAVEEREGWPSLPGSYSTMRYQAPVALCAGEFRDHGALQRINVGVGAAYRDLWYRFYGRQYSKTGY